MIKYFFIVCIFFVSCQENPESKKRNELTGEVLRIQEPSEVKSIFPPSAISGGEKRIVANIYEGLMRINPLTLLPEPSLADSYYVSKDKKEYTFIIRKNIYFHADNSFRNPDKRELTVHDIKNCLTFLCSSDSLNKYSGIFSTIIEGGKEYYNRTAENVSGIQVPDNRTIRIKLIQSSPEFMYFLADPCSFIYPQEWMEKYVPNEIDKKASGTGPFKFHSWEKYSIRLTKNENYYGQSEEGKKLPYLDGVEFKLWIDNRQAYNEYKKENLDIMTDASADHIFEIEEKEKNYTEKSQIIEIPELYSCIILINHKNTRNREEKIVKSMTYSIDKNYIHEAILNGDERPGVYGIVPPLFQKYGYKSRLSYNYNKDSLSHYSDGKGRASEKRHTNLFSPRDIEDFPYGPFSSLRSITIEAEVQKQWIERMNLYTDVYVLGKKEFRIQLTSGKEGVYFYPLKGCFPSPQGFLHYFYSKNEYRYPYGFYINKSVYYNYQFDEYYEKALMADTREEESLYFKLAEETLLADGRINPLFYKTKWLTIKSYVKEFPVSSYSYYYLGNVYIEKNQL